MREGSGTTEPTEPVGTAGVTVGPCFARRVSG